MTKKEKKKIKFSKLIVSLVILLNAIFAAVVLIIFFKVGNEPVALTSAWFAFTGTELWNLASIKNHDTGSE